MCVCLFVFFGTSPKTTPALPLTRSFASRLSVFFLRAATIRSYAGLRVDSSKEGVLRRWGALRTWWVLRAWEVLRKWGRGSSKMGCLRSSGSEDRRTRGAGEAALITIILIMIITT